MGEDIYSFFEYRLLKFGKIDLHVHHLIAIAIVFLLIKLVLWGIQKYFKKHDKNHIDRGRHMAVYQLAKYFLIVFGVAVSLEIVGMNFTFLIAGSTALLVGLGFGIQSTFNDIFSGIVLLFEGSVSIEDVIEVDGLVGKVEKIDIRTSKILTRNNITIVVPNSKLTSENVINWSHNRDIARFSIKIGVAYGSDLDKVKYILESLATQHNSVDAKHEPEVRFADFGESSLDFELLFYSSEMFRIEKIKSDIRFEIDRRFRKEGISIPFPQRDVHLKTPLQG